MATRTLLKRLAYREVHVNVPPLTRLSVDVPLWHGEGAKTARNFTRRFLPTIRFHQNDAFVATLKRSADVPKPAITVEYADGKTREFDPAELTEFQIFHALSGGVDIPVSISNKQARLALPKAAEAPAEGAGSDAAAGVSATTASSPSPSTPPAGAVASPLVEQLVGMLGALEKGRRGDGSAAIKKKMRTKVKEAKAAEKAARAAAELAATGPGGAAKAAAAAAAAPAAAAASGTAKKAAGKAAAAAAATSAAGAPATAAAAPALA